LSERIIHEAVTSVTSEDQVIDLCAAGRYREAATALEGLDPDRFPLAFGMVEVVRGNQDLAKDYLSQAIRKGAGDGAKLQLACAYYHAGEVKEAGAILDELPDSFDVLLLRAILASDLDPRAALDLLDKASAFAAPPGKQARLHNQRAIALRRIGETDRAIREYDAAIHCFEEAMSDQLPAAINNLARVYLDCGDYEGAHAQIDRAISLLARDSDLLAKSYDEKARIYLAQTDLESANRYARMAIREIERTERKGWLAECLVTHARILLLRGEITKALIQADRAEEIGRFLNNDQIVLEACPVKKEIGKTLMKRSDISRIEAEVRSAGGVRAAARKLGVSHVALLRTLKRS
jgi:tetratricopeptide (TPR) repeat protein